MISLAMQIQWGNGPDKQLHIDNLYSSWTCNMKVKENLKKSN